MLDSKFGPLWSPVRGGGKLMLLPSSTQDSAFLPHRKENNQLLIDAINKLERSDVFVDIGSNIGFYSLRASQRLGPAGMVVSIEPSSREFSRLAAAKFNNQHACQWALFNCGIGPKGRHALEINAGHTGMNHLKPRQASRQNDSQPGGAETISLATLDDLLTVLGIEQIQLLKIDIEGFELQALQSFRRLLSSGAIKTIVIEITDRFLKRFGDSRAQLYQVMDECQFVPQIGLSSHWQYDDIFYHRGQ